MNSSAALASELEGLIKEGDEMMTPFREYVLAYAEGSAEDEAPSLSAIAYETWYTRALDVIRILAPARLDDFVEHYRLKKAPSGKFWVADIRLSDAVVGRTPHRAPQHEIAAAIGLHLHAQISLVTAVLARLGSVLADIRSALQAEILDDELATAGELAKAHHLRSAGALCGVVLERHLREVCANHSIKIAKKKPTLSDFFQALKDNGVIDTPTWRKLQHLGDIRNLSAHDAEREPTKDEIADMLRGTDAILKTVH